MNRILISLVMILMGLVSYAQETKNYFEESQMLYKNGTPEIREHLDSITKPYEQKWQAEQVKSIGGIPFGISREKAQIMLRNKFGSHEYDPSSTNLTFKNIKYAGYDFNSAIFMFQSDGIDSYFNTCIFVIEAKCLSEAMLRQKELYENLSQKYDLSNFAEKDGIPMYAGGISPLWDGHWYNFDTSHAGAVKLDIIEYSKDIAKSLGITHGVRIVYGPYNYINEEF